MLYNLLKFQGHVIITQFHLEWQVHEVLQCHPEPGLRVEPGPVGPRVVPGERGPSSTPAPPPPPSVAPVKRVRQDFPDSWIWTETILRYLENNKNYFQN